MRRSSLYGRWWCVHRDCQNRICAPYMIVCMVITAKNNVCTPYIRTIIWFWPTLCVQQSKVLVLDNLQGHNWFYTRFTPELLQTKGSHTEGLQHNLREPKEKQSLNR